MILFFWCPTVTRITNLTRIPQVASYCDVLQTDYVDAAQRWLDKKQHKDKVGKSLLSWVTKETAGN